MPTPPDAYSLYVYAIAASDTAAHAKRCRAVGDENAVVSLLSQGGLAAVVSSVSGRPRARRRDLSAHQDVLRALAANGPVLPMRFGVIAPDAETVLTGLDSARTAHLDALERLAGKAEWNLKGASVPEALPDLMREDANLRALRESTRRRPGYEANVSLGQAVAAGLQRRAEQAAAEVVAQLRPLAAELSEGRDIAGGALNASFLVPHAAETAFRRAVDTLAARHQGRIALTLTGPLPCYSFVAAEAVPTGA
ncbi:GvpL/GvpF family gas vesicle protein [Streptomyces sp. NPDC057302]|uniref:GvpL/GvpF family gas vesicle protein n=1 Tax=Streptomyces sp. NPDC057302 TaxID=3346094 RepID=UPI003632AE95